MSKSFGTNNLRMRFVAVFLCVWLLVSCQTDEAALKNDALATQTLNQANKVLSAGKKLSREDFSKLKEVYNKYPNSKFVRDIYYSALIKKQDWATLEEFFNEIPASELTDKDKINFGKTSIKLGRYKDAIERLKPLVIENNFEAKILLANAYFHTGNYDESKKLLDENWEQIIKEKKPDEIALRGIIYFHQGDKEKAIETLNKSIEIEPDNIPANNGLSRIYAAKGDTEKAEKYLEKIQKSFDKVTAEEKRKTNLVEKFANLKAAYKAKRFQEVITLANQVLPDADTRNKVVIYQYLYNSYRALGKQKEAQEVLEKAKQIQQK